MEQRNLRYSVDAALYTAAIIHIAANKNELEARHAA